MSEILNSYFGSVFTKENVSDNLPEVEQVFKLFKGDLSSNLTDLYYNNTRGDSREIKEK